MPVVLLVAILALVAAPASAAETWNVSMRFDPGYSPADLAIAVGDTVVWTNDDTGNNHSVTADDGSFDSNPCSQDQVCRCPGAWCLSLSQSYTRTFDRPGVFAYRCNQHSSMHGVVRVGPEAATAGVRTPPGTAGRTASSPSPRAAATAGDRTSGSPRPVPVAAPAGGTASGGSTVRSAAKIFAGNAIAFLIILAVWRMRRRRRPTG